MLPATAFTQILQGITAALLLAPKAAELIQATRELFRQLFTANLITKEQQEAVSEYVDSVCRLAEAGVIPPHWEVRPDPPQA